MVRKIITESKEEKSEQSKPVMKGVIIGTIELRKGNATVTATDSEEKINIAPENLHNALNNDTVEVRLFAQREGADTEGEVTKIVERYRTNFVGTVEKSKNFAFIVPNRKIMPYDIFVPLNKLMKAKNGDKAVVKITEWPDGAKNPIGEVIEVLGATGENETEMHAILVEFDLPYAFDEEVEKAADEIPVEIPEEEIKKRKDIRDICTFTIDPADAKDFDDAISIRKLDNRNFEIGVHIADVSHYIRPESILDKEAYNRATSVYLVDRVVPMLPEALSNGLCSLRPDEDKLCFSAVFELNEKAELQSEWFGKTVIRSNRRFCYEEAQKIIETGEGDLKEEILKAWDLAKQLRKRRFDDGSINFDRAEVKFILDEKGKPLDVFFKESKEANWLVEEFMLLANKRVATFVGEKRSGNRTPKTFVYRIHDEPDLEKLATFQRFIGKFGYNINLNDDEMIGRSVNELMDKIKGKDEQEVISMLAVRAMAKAVYSTENIGHYGLHFPFYTHFTSPIRRYPDMMVHRLLFKYLQGGRSEKKSDYAGYCKHCSEMEYRAVQAERASDKYKEVEYMRDKLGEIFMATISGITEWGLYAEIEGCKIEGMISIRDLDDDFYMFDEENYCLIGHYNKKKFQLGDKLQIKVAKANLERKQLDFVLADSTKKIETDPDKADKQNGGKQRKSGKKNYTPEGGRSKKSGQRSHGRGKGGKKEGEGNSSSQKRHSSHKNNRNKE